MARGGTYRVVDKLARIIVLVVLCLVCGGAVVRAASSVFLGNVTVTLQSAQYYANGDYTRFTYELAGTTTPSCAYWILGLCPEARTALLSTSPASEWVETPMPGLRFVPTARNEKFYVYVAGVWGLDATPVGVSRGAAGLGQVLTGSIDGPSCGSQSLSLAVIAGGAVVFPVITGPGLFPALNGTTLRVQSTASGWILTTSEGFVVPPGGSESVVGRIFEVAAGSYVAASGTTDVVVGYALRVAAEDLGTLPQGTYEIVITYTVVLN